MTEVVPLSARAVPSAPRSPSEQLVYSTVRIEAEMLGGGRGFGTGFFFHFCRQAESHVPGIVTNKHVVAGAVKGHLSFHLKGDDGRPSLSRSERFVLEDFGNAWIPHPDPTVDLCVLPIAPLIKHAETNGHVVSYVALDTSLIPSDAELASLTPLEEVLMIGYPNGIWDSVNNMPILRRGVTATHPAIKYEGRREFMIDAACFPGSSGSPVMLYNVGGYYMPNGDFAIGGSRVKLLGILYAGTVHTVTGELQIVTLPTSQSILPLSRIPNNLGVVIQSSRLRDFEPVIHNMLASSA